MQKKTSNSKALATSPPPSEVKCFAKSVSLPSLKEPRDVLKMLNLVMTRAAKGLLDPKLANCLFQGCNIALRAFEVVQTQEDIEYLSKRLDELERKPINIDPVIKIREEA